MADLDPVSLVPSALSVLGGIGQALFSGRRRKEKDLENFANSYQPNQGIMDYYNKALAKYSANPYESQSYQNQKNLIQRNLATGIGSTQDRRGGLQSIVGLTQAANDASAKAGAMAEGQQAQALGQLGQAAGAAAREQSKKFDMLYNLKAMKAGQAAATQNQGFKNIFGGLSNASEIIGDQLNNGSGIDSWDSYRRTPKNMRGYSSSRS